MYDAVFSALMTLTGLTFAALGLLLDGQETHWIRHAHVWEKLSRKSLPVVGVLVTLTSALILWRVDRADAAYSLWWNVAVALFCLSLLALVLPIEHARRLIKPDAILERLRLRHVADVPLQNDLDKDEEWTDRAGDVVKSYMSDVKEILSGSLGSVDLNGYRTVHEVGLVRPSHPKTGLKDCVPDQRLDGLRIKVAGLLAEEALGEARAQFDASTGSRAVNVICATTVKQIVEAWAEHDTVEARGKVLHKGCDVLARCLEGALSAPRPSQTLIDELVEALSSVLGRVDPTIKHGAISRLVVGVERADSAGYVSEGGSALRVFTPEVLDSVDSMVILVKALIAEYEKDQQSVSVTSAFQRLVREWMTDINRPDGDKSLLAHRMTPELVATARLLSPSGDRLSRLVQIVADLVPRIKARKLNEVLLSELQDADDTVLELFMKHVYANEGDLDSRDQMLYTFHLTRLRSSQVDAGEAVRGVITWLDPAAVHLARVKPERLGMLRKHACGALRNVYTQACNVNPVFLSVIFARIRAERAALKDGSAPLPPIPAGTLSNPADGQRDPSRPPSARVPISQVLWHCYDTLAGGLALSREKNLPVPFSAEVRRSALGSLSLLFCDLDEMADEEVVDLLFDEKLVWSVETAFDLGVDDLGDVPLYLDRIRAAAWVALGLVGDRSARAKNLRTRWMIIGLQCEEALAVGGFGRPVPAATAETDQTAEEKVDATSAAGLPFDAVSPALASPQQRLLDVLSMQVDVRGQAGAAANTRVANIRERMQFSSALLERKWDPEAPEVEVMREVVVPAQASAAPILTEPEAREVSCLVMAELTLQRLPKWAVRTRTLVDQALRTSDTELMFMVLRTSRSCLARAKGVRNAWWFPPRSPGYVFGDRSLGNESLFKNGRIAMEAAISDWVLNGINSRPGADPSLDEKEQELKSVVGATVAAMERRFRGEKELLREIRSFWNVETDLRAQLAVAVQPAAAADDVPDDMTDAEA